MSFDLKGAALKMETLKGLNPFRTGRCLSTLKNILRLLIVKRVSIPFEQGDVFRHLKVELLSARESVSIPFEQGDVFRQVIYVWYQYHDS